MSDDKDQNVEGKFNELTKFCTLYTRGDTGVHVIGHSYLQGCRHEVEFQSDDRVMIKKHNNAYKIGMSKATFLNQVRKSVYQSLNEAAARIISDFEYFHLNRGNVGGTKIGPFNITNVAVETESLINEAFDKGMYSIKLSIKVYDNWLLFKKVRSKHNMIIGFAKDQIFVTMCNKDPNVIETYGMCEYVSDVDSLMSKLIMMEEGINDGESMI